jgi:transposase
MLLDIARVNDRRMFDGIFGVLQSGAPWRDPDRDLWSRTRTIARGTHCRWQRSRGSFHMDHAFLALTASGIALLLVSFVAALALH